MSDLSHNFYRIFSSAWRQRYVILIPMILLPIAGFVISQTTAKSYYSHTSLLIQETSKMNPFLEDFSVSALLKERMSSLSTLLHSRHILNIVAEKRGLINDQTTQQEIDIITSTLSNSLTVKMQGKDLIMIEMKSPTTDGMKETLEIVSEQFVEQLLAPERSSMTDSMSFLNSQLEIKRMDIEKAEKKLAEFKSTYAEELPELFNSNISRLTSLKQTLSETEAAYKGALTNLGSIDSQLSKTNPVVAKLELQIINTQNELAVLRGRYTDNHSQVQAALSKLESLESERLKSLNNNKNIGNDDTLTNSNLLGMVLDSDLPEGAKDSPLLMSQIQKFQESRTKVESLSEEIKSLTSMINSLEEKASGFGELEGQYSKLERDLNVKREFYDDLLNRYEMAKVTGSLSIFEQNKRVKIIDKPYTPTSSTNLPAIFFIIAGLFGGIFLGVGVAIVIEISDNTVRYKSQIEQITKSPYLGKFSAY